MGFTARAAEVYDREPVWAPVVWVPVVPPGGLVR